MQVLINLARVEKMNKKNWKNFKNVNPLKNWNKSVDAKSSTMSSAQI